MERAREELNAISEAVIGGAYAIANELGNGFLEKVYENSMMHELRKRGLSAEQQRAINVFYDGVLVGEYFADLLVESSVIIELKAVKALDDHHLAQCLNYLKATRLRLCLLINFGSPRVEIKRIVHNF